MKKFTFFLILSLLVLSGCDKKKEEIKKETIICSIENTNDGTESLTKIEANIENDIVKSAKAIITYQSETFAKTMCNIFSKAEDSKDNVKCEDKQITIDNYHKSINEEELNKKEFLDYMDNQDFVCE